MELVIKASHGELLRKSTGILYISRFTRFQYTRRFAKNANPAYDESPVIDLKSI
jgi:hypothetical protein